MSHITKEIEFLLNYDVGKYKRKWYQFWKPEHEVRVFYTKEVKIFVYIKNGLSYLILNLDGSIHSMSNICPHVIVRKLKEVN